MKKYPMYINGEWISNDNWMTVSNPFNYEEIGVVPFATEKEIDLAITSADEAFNHWRKISVYERVEYLHRWYELIDRNKEIIARTLTMEQGKPIKEAIGEVQYANSFLEWYKEEGKRLYGETIPSQFENKRILIQKHPVGVVAAITPWNFPAAMITRKVAPALVAGCTVIVKPASQTPLTALLLATYAHEAGIPKGVLNVLTGKASLIGDKLLSDSRVKKITFTGSTEIGKQLMEQAAKTMKNISLELGGHAPFIVFEDADIEKAVQGAVQSKFRNAGQTCICTNRIYVHESIKTQFNNQLVEAVGKLKIGNGLLTETDIGPLIDHAAIQKVQTHIENATNKGAILLYGGKIVNNVFIEPTVISDVNDDMLLMKEETFGPIAPITTFKDEKEVLNRANNSKYGLAAYVYTKDLSRMFRVTENLEYGIIGVNDSAPSTAQAPFGGMKESGLGREGGHYGLEEYLEVKYVSIGI